MINKVMSLNKLECGNIFSVPHSSNWYMRTDTGYINLDNGLTVSEVDSKYWKTVLLIYERLGEIALDAEEADITYLTQWWA